MSTKRRRIVYAAKSSGRKSSVFILGGGSPKNFMLQTEPQIQEVLGHRGKGARLFSAMHRRPPGHRRVERRDAGRGRQLGQGRPEQPARLRGGVSGFDGGAAIIDSLCVKPASARGKLKRLYDKRDEIYEKVKSMYLKIGTVTKIQTSRKTARRASKGAA